MSDSPWKMCFLAILAAGPLLAVGCGESKQSVAELSGRLSNEDAGKRYDALKAIETRIEEGESAEVAVPHLQKALADTDAKVRYRATKALAKLGPVAAPAVAELAKVLAKDKAKSTRYYAVKALHGIGRPAADAMESLIAALKDENVDVRYYAAKTLGMIGPEAAVAKDSLTELSHDRDTKVRDAALAALEKIAEAQKPTDSPPDKQP